MKENNWARVKSSQKQLLYNIYTKFLILIFVHDISSNIMYVGSVKSGYAPKTFQYYFLSQWLEISYQPIKLWLILNIDLKDVYRIQYTWTLILNQYQNTLKFGATYRIFKQMKNLAFCSKWLQIILIPLCITLYMSSLFQYSDNSSLCFHLSRRKYLNTFWRSQHIRFKWVNNSDFGQ